MRFFLERRRYSAAARRNTAERPARRTSSSASSRRRSSSSIMICIGFMLIDYHDRKLRRLGLCKAQNRLSPFWPFPTGPRLIVGKASFASAQSGAFAHLADERLQPSLELLKARIASQGIEEWIAKTDRPA